MTGTARLPDWRDRAAYDAIPALGRDALAWEVLRRDPVYRRFAAASALTAEMSAGEIGYSVAAKATTASDATNIHRFDSRILPDVDGEHVRLIVHGEVFRLDVVSGTVMSGPVHLTYQLAQDGRLVRKIDTIQRLEQALAGIEPGPVAGTSRIVRSAMALRAYDARADGASLREMAAIPPHVSALARPRWLPEVAREWARVSSVQLNGRMGRPRIIR
ncbi:transcriptional regulator domain-containing protein [Sphingobium aromaticiconvertens]|uniref:transcriptional regulator domain-containing protein n=1 Tax=Sphingobium aromaticiconvertens TaxID=365341 RepID=UPI0030189E5B